MTLSRRQQCVVEKAIKILEFDVKRSTIESPADLYDYIKLKMSARKNEAFGCVFLSQRNQVIESEILFHGTIDGTTVHPRVVVQKVMEHNAASVILFHNHPSGVPEPSQADQRITERLAEALALVDVQILDHVVVGMQHYVSFKERGLL